MMFKIINNIYIYRHTDTYTYTLSEQQQRRKQRKKKNQYFSVPFFILCNFVDENSNETDPHERKIKKSSHGTASKYIIFRNAVFAVIVRVIADE